MNAMKKTNAKKKLIPAAAMLAISAAMLSTATYAWFTMSKSVEITGINMTASAPAGLQMSLGLAQGTGGSLTAIGDDTSKGVDMVKAPENTDTSADWSNSVQFSRYYQVSKLKPASSTTGATIYYTADATVVGKTIKANAVSETASSAAAKQLISTSNTTPLTSEGYYIDFPVWFRSAESGDVNLSVKAIVGKGSATPQNSSNFIYKAARVSILGGVNMDTSTGVIVPFDANDQKGSYYPVSERPEKGTTGVALNAPGTNNNGSVFGPLTEVAQTGESTPTTVITVPGKTTQTIASTAYSTGNCTDDSVNYGPAVCVYVRVWLEGEDVNCWNATAGQDFDLTLQFSIKE